MGESGENQHEKVQEIWWAQVTWRDSEISPGLPEDSVALSEETKQQLRGAVAASQQERCVLEKSQQVFLSGGPRERKNRKERQ